MAQQKNGAGRPAERHLQPALVSAYLSAKGWQQDKEQVWTFKDGSKSSAEFRQPPDFGTAEAAQQITDLIAQLTRTESRSPGLIFTALAHADADLLRVALFSGETPDSTPGFENAVKLVQGLQRLLVAVAWTTAEPAPYLGGKKPKQVGDF